MLAHDKVVANNEIQALKQKVRDLERDLRWALANLCDDHKAMQTMSSGPCPMCENARLITENVALKAISTWQPDAIL